MKNLFWIGLIVLILGIVSLFVPIPRNERDSIKVGGMSMGVETQHSEKLSPIVGGVMILAGAGMMIAGKRRV
jgi:nucleoside recognition membrane protein YjiH